MHLTARRQRLGPPSYTHTHTYTCVCVVSLCVCACACGARARARVCMCVCVLYTPRNEKRLSYRRAVLFHDRFYNTSARFPVSEISLA